MTVQELIAALQAQDPNARVMIGLMVGDEEEDRAVDAIQMDQALVTDAAGTNVDEHEIVVGETYVQLNGWWG